jgi:virginiamycin B lyase
VHDYVGRLSPDGTLKLFRIPTLGSVPKGIAEGPDGNMWFAAIGAIERLTPSGRFTRFPIPNGAPQGIAAGRGGMWFTDNRDDNTNKIGFITLSGKVTEYPAPRHAERGLLSAIAVRQDGIWFQDILESGPGFIGHLAFRR